MTATKYLKADLATCVSKQAQYKTAMFNAINEADNGQNTSNPYILAKRVIDSKQPIDLSTLNSILKFHNIIISDEEFNMIKGITPVSLHYPLPAADDNVMSILGKANNGSDKVVGAYVLTYIETGKQYVGGTLNMAKRVRYYYGSKGLLETRTIAKLMAKHGPSAFSLNVYVLDTTMIYPLVTSARISNLVLALEQYLILYLKPTLNGVLVVGGVSTNMSGLSALAEVAAKKMKQVYLYTKNMSELVYVSPSRAGFVKDSNLNQTTVNRRLNDGKPVYNTYIISDKLIDTATISLMTSTELGETMAVLHKNRIQLRNNSSKVNSNMHPIYLTDLKSEVSTRVFFVSKAQAQQYTEKIGRSINIKQFNKPIPFTLNGWLVEFAFS